jgi:hypothetical protein
MLWLNIRSHQQARFRIFNKRTMKYSTVKFWGPDLCFTLMYNCTELCKST